MATRGTDSGIKIRGGFLFYGGFVSTAEGGAYLHRYSLADGTDIKLVRLGIAGHAGCQVTFNPCNWTGPWDVSPDGSHIVYHNPGPKQSISDTAIEPSTPLYYATSNGSGATKLFASQTLPQYFSSPFFSPDGALVVATAENDAIQAVTDGAVVALPTDNHFTSWRGDGKAAIVFTLDAGYHQIPALFDIASGRLTVLPGDPNSYVWGA
jgi:hypothetical protein